MILASETMPLTLLCLLPLPSHESGSILFVSPISLKKKQLLTPATCFYLDKTEEQASGIASLEKAVAAWDRCRKSSYPNL